MDDTGLELVKRIHREAIDRFRATEVSPPPEPVTIPHTQLPQLPLDHALFREWDTYRREVANWLEQGFEGMHVLIKVDDILAFGGRYEAAYITALEMMLLGQLEPPFLIHRIRSEESVEKLNEITSPWPRSSTQRAQTA